MLIKVNNFDACQEDRRPTLRRQPQDPNLQIVLGYRKRYTLSEKVLKKTIVSRLLSTAFLSYILLFDHGSPDQDENRIVISATRYFSLRPLFLTVIEILILIFMTKWLHRLKLSVGARHCLFGGSSYWDTAVHFIGAIQRPRTSLTLSHGFLNLSLPVFFSLSLTPLNASARFPSPGVCLRVEDPAQYPR